MIEALRSCLSSWKPPDATGEYARRMWRHTLDYHALPAADRRDGSGALPYLPIDPDALGCRLTAADSLLDVGCLGGYGLFDIAENRRHAGAALPRLIGVDQAASSIELTRIMAKHWAGGTATDFLRADAMGLPLPDKTCRVVVARLLLPYTSIDDTLRELTRVLANDGLLYLQVHGPRYYLGRISARYRRPRIASYYMRPLLACAWLRFAGRQPDGAWFRETALTSGMLRRLAGQHGLTERWRGTDRARPFAAYGRKS